MRTPAPLLLRRALFALGLLCLATAAWFALERASEGPPPDSAGAPEAQARYIGVQACRACHQYEHASYQETPHSRALRPVDPTELPLPHEFTHGPSGLTYRMSAKNGGLRVQQSILLENGRDRAILGEHTMRWAVGSGALSLSYAAEVDGFLVESPTTWYRTPKIWGVSPGYDMPQHQGFSRPLDQRCLFCHVGRTESLGGSGERMRIHEEAIGCERCHGPGSRHAAAREAVPDFKGPDPTIIHPERLSRRQQMDLCAQCHLDHSLSVPVHGKRMADWRPGQPLNEFRLSYRLEQDADQMTVVGHVDQLTRSRCYLGSDTLTCITCHDPHERPAEKEREAYYNGACHTCHDAKDACGKTGTERAASPQGNDCVACHMPRGDTEIPHFAFTDHRIAIHRPKKDGHRLALPPMRLVAQSDDTGLPPIERERHLAFAYLLLSIRHPEDIRRPTISAEEYAQCLAQARALLKRVHGAGVRDAAVLGALAFLQQERDPRQSLALAREAAAANERLAPDMRCSILQTLTGALIKAGAAAEALRHLDELVALRRNATDWVLRASACRTLGKRAEAVRSAQQAVSIGGHEPRIQRFAAQIHRWAGDRKSALRHQRIAAQLERARQR